MNYYQSPRWTGEVLDCSMPMTFDTYNKCSYQCLYCFSFYQRSHTIGLDESGNYIKALTWVNVDKIKKLFLLDKSLKSNHNSQFFPYIKNRMVLQYGGLSDPFDEYERREGITLELLKFFKSIDYPLCFSTKGTWWIYDSRYRDLVKGQKNWNCKFTIINLDEAKAKKIEIGCPTPSERLDAIGEYTTLNKEGGATLRLRPIILGMSETGDEYLKLIARARAKGATAVSTEFFCLDTRANEDLIKRYDRISEILGYDLYKFYKEHSTGAGYRRLNRKLKYHYFQKIKDLCDELNMRFYVSDAHGKEFCNNGSCCGLPKSWNYSRGQFTEALLIAREKGQVEFSDIKDSLEMFKKFKWKDTKNYNLCTTQIRVKRDDFTMYDYFRFMWNSPNQSKSPYKYFGGALVPKGKDTKGDIIYEYSPMGSEI